MSNDARERLIAAVFKLAEESVATMTFSHVIDQAAVPRATAYRLFPRGLDSILVALHQEMVDEAVASIRAAIRLQGSVDFTTAVDVGVRELLRALRSSALAQKVFRREPSFMPQYLLNDRPGSLFAMLADYAAGCAASFGSNHEDLRDASGRFMFSVLSDIVADVNYGPHTWPDSERLSVILNARIEGFVAETGLKGEHEGDVRREQAIAPLITVPDSIESLKIYVLQ